MPSDESILKEMLNRVTDSSRESVDRLGSQMFCMLLGNDKELISKAHDMILAKIRSNNSTEAIRAIALLEECMTKCGPEFQHKTSKYVFLNNFISLISKNYEGANTSTEIKDRIMECLLLWTTEFPQNKNIYTVYDKLKKQEEVDHHNSSATAIPKRDNCLGIDENTLVALLHSKDPANLMRANLLIQRSVNEEVRRTELRTQHKIELEKVQNTANLLSEMINACVGEQYDAFKDSDNAVLMKDLYLSCKEHKKIVDRLPELIEKDDLSLLADTLETNDILRDAMKRYKNIVAPNAKSPSGTTSDTLNSHNPASMNEDISKLLGDLPVANSSVNSDSLFKEETPTRSDLNKNMHSTANTLEELRQIFGEADGNCETSTTTKSANAAFESCYLLQPIPVISDNDTKNDLSNCDVTSTVKSAPSVLPEIDKISSELLMKSLESGGMVESPLKKFVSREPAKCTLNDLVKEKLNVKPMTSVLPASSNKTSGLGEDSGRREISIKALDDCVLSVNTPDVSDDVLMLGIEHENSSPIVVDKKITELPNKHLSEINLNLEEVIPTGEMLHVATEDVDLEITLNFTENRPSKEVSVVVMSVVNKCKLPVKDFHFEASVRKPCKVRMLPPTDTAMEPFKPFRALVPINQIMLLLNPTGRAVDATCIVGYKLGDDPDPIKESIVVKEIPYVQ